MPQKRFIILEEVETAVFAQLFHGSIGARRMLSHRVHIHLTSAFGTFHFFGELLDVFGQQRSCWEHLSTSLTFVAGLEADLSMLRHLLDEKRLTANLTSPEGPGMHEATGRPLSIMR